MSSREAELLQELLDKQALHELNARWARSIDRGDSRLFLECYHDGAVEVHGAFHGSPNEFLETIFPRLRLANCYHFITNELYVVDGDRATGDLYCPVFYDAVLEARRSQGDQPTGRRLSSGGRYLDRYERRDGRWGIVYRTVVSDWPSEDARIAGGFVTGTQDGSDPMYELYSPYTLSAEPD